MPRQVVYKRKLIIISAIILAVLSIGGYVGFKATNKGDRQTEQTRQLARQATGFTPYLPVQAKLPNSYIVRHSNVRLEQDVLTIPLGNQLSSLTLTEQPVPEEYKNGNFVGKNSLPTRYGNAALSSIDSRTTAILITKNKDAMIIANTADPVTNDVLRAVLNTLEPIK